MNICAFCGSGTGTNPVYAEATREFAKLLIKNNYGLVYGGGNVGLMGILADEMLANSGKVIGVIPDFLVQREVAHRGLSELMVVSSMHERKQRMADLADCFVALPGGMGTLDELAEILTWKQLGLIKNPVGLLNTHRYFDPLISQLQKMVEEGFLKRENLETIKISDKPLQLLTLLGVVAV
jgi:uncharacterized protein (TIGR00730 family)